MRWPERLENRLHWLAIPSCFKWVALLSVVVFAAQWINPDITAILAFDRAAMLRGEWWRLLTFVFDFGFHGLSALTVLFLFFAVMIGFLMNDTLEAAWGSTRLTLYVLTTWITLAVAHWLMPVPLGGSGIYLYSAMFFAFATRVPHYKFLLFLILPVQVGWLAWISLALLTLSALKSPILFLPLAAIAIPYALWVLPELVGWRAHRPFSSKLPCETESEPETKPFHQCASCGRTEQDDPTLDFRTLADGTEYCTEHLPKTSP